MRREGAQKRILVMRYRFIGDTILTVPFLRNLRRAEPHAWIAWLVAPGSVEAIHGIPYVDELIYWDTSTIYAGGSGAHGTLAAKIQFAKKLRALRFDKVYVLKRSLSSAVLSRLSGAKKRIGFNTEGRGFLLTTGVPYRHDRHEVQNFLEVLRRDNIPVEDDYLEAWLSPEEQAFATDFLVRHGVSGNDPIIGIHPFAANQVRAWHEDNFIALANRLQAEYGARILLFGGGSDTSLGEYFRKHIVPDPLMAVGTTSLRQTMALLARCSLIVCNDSGIMHLAAALNRPLVAVFGPQSPVKFGPWGKQCRVVYKAFTCSPCRQKFFKECEPSPRQKPACLEAIDVQEVLDVIKSLKGVWDHVRMQH